MPKYNAHHVMTKSHQQRRTPELSKPAVFNPLPSFEIEVRLAYEGKDKGRLELAKDVLAILEQAHGRFELWSRYSDQESFMVHVRSIIHHCLDREGNKFAKIVERRDRNPRTFTPKRKTDLSSRRKPDTAGLVVKNEQAGEIQTRLKPAMAQVRVWAEEDKVRLQGQIYSAIIKDKLGIFDHRKEIFHQIAVGESFRMENDSPVLVARQVDVEYKGQVRVYANTSLEQITQSALEVAALLRAELPGLRPTSQSQFSALKESGASGTPEDLEDLREFLDNNSTPIAIFPVQKRLFED